MSIFFALLLAFGQLQAGEQPGKTRAQAQTSATLSQTGGEAWSGLDRKQLKLRSASALIVDGSGNRIYSKQSQTPLPIGSITKLMTVMVILDAQLPLDEKIRITKQDRDLIRLTGSRLRYGATLSRSRLLDLALMASENRAASALARTYPGGSGQFIQAMNAKARQLGMKDSRFTDAAGLDAGNVASPEDLVRMVRAASEYPEIVQATTRLKLDVRPYPRLGPLTYGNTNRLLKNQAWEISLSKTGYINEAGRCLVMLARVNGRELIFVLLNSFGKLTPFGDANRVRKWIERGVSG
jgi:D-alanyl-D-alanine endopeptidase (penicillin-binding protein 7)